MSLSDPPAFDTQGTRELLQSALDFKKDAGATHTPTSRSFLPSRHFRALNPDYPLVLGGRGAGKTHWARALTSPGDLAVVLQAHQEQGVRMEGAVVSFFQRAQVHIGYDENSRAGELPSREECIRKQCSGQRKLLPRSLGLDLGSLSEERQLEGLRNELMGLGIFFIRNDGRIDLPEVIRIGYGLRRRGAVRPPARKPF